MLIEEVPTLTDELLIQLCVYPGCTNHILWAQNYCKQHYFSSYLPENPDDNSK